MIINQKWAVASQKKIKQKKKLLLRGKRKQLKIELGKKLLIKQRNSLKRKQRKKKLRDKMLKLQKLPKNY